MPSGHKRLYRSSGSLALISPRVASSCTIMRFAISVAAGLALLAGSVTALEETKEVYCLSGCREAFAFTTFNTTPSGGDYYQTQCNDTLRTQSLYLCAAAYCTPAEIKAGMEYYQWYCKKEIGIVFPAYADVVTRELEATLSNKSMFFSLEEWKPLYPINTTTVPDPRMFNLALRTISTWSFTINAASYYGYGMIAFWALVLLFGLVARFVSWVSYRSTIKLDSNRVAARQRGVWGKIQRFYRRYFALPAMFGFTHSDSASNGWFTIPTRIQGITVLAFISLNIICMCTSYFTFRQNLYWEDPANQAYRYVADRSGIMSFANMPLLWFFAVRNNLFLWATGWHFATFNVFHRWIARVAVLEAVIHSITYTVLIYREGGKAEYVSYLKDGDWFYTGIVGTILWCLLIPLSMYYFRQRMYEFFLRMHILIAAGSLVALYRHVLIFEGEYMQYVWACVGVWAFDRLVSGCRLLVLNFKMLVGKNPRAVVSYHPDKNVMRINIAPSYHATPMPGAYYFLYFPTIGFRGYESHPFTLSSWTGSDSRSNSTWTSGSTSPISPINEKTIEAHGNADPLSPTLSDTSSDSNAKGPLQLSFIIKPFNGVTKKLRERALRNNNHIEIPIVIEGPYGAKHHIHRFENVILIAGGTGITAIIPYLHNLFNDKTGMHTPGVRTKHIHMVFTARHAGLVKDISERELRNAFIRPEVTIDLAVTRDNDKTADSDILGSFADRLAGEKNNLSLRHQRLDLRAIINRQVETAPSNIALLVCGPAKMGDVARRAVVDLTGQGHEIHYFEELFGW